MAPSELPASSEDRRGAWSRVSKLFNGVLIPILAVATPILVALLAWSVDVARQDIDRGQQRLSREIAKLDAELKRLEADRLERESLQRYNIIVLKEVKESLAKDDPVVQKVVIGLLQSMPNQELAQTWLTALEQSENTTDDNKVAAKNVRQAIEYDQVQKQILATAILPRTAREPQTPFNWEDYDYDIFWCEGSPSKAEQDAEEIVQRMTSQGAKGRLRVRMLPIKVNERSGFGIEGYEIRQNTDEGDQAQALKNIGDQVIEGRGSFAVGTSTQSTRFYLSAFICPK